MQTSTNEEPFMTGKKQKASKRCDHAGERALQWHQIANGKLQLRSLCGECGKFQGYAPQTPDNKVEAARQHLEPKGCTWTLLAAWGFEDLEWLYGSPDLPLAAERNQRASQGSGSALSSEPVLDEPIEEIDPFWAPDLPSDPEQEPELLEDW